MIYVLAIAAVLSLALGEIKEASFIYGVLIISAIIGTFQESRAEKASKALRNLLSILVVARDTGVAGALIVPHKAILATDGYHSQST